MAKCGTCNQTVKPLKARVAKYQHICGRCGELWTCKADHKPEPAWDCFGLIGCPACVQPADRKHVIAKHEATVQRRCVRPTLLYVLMPSRPD